MAKHLDTVSALTAPAEPEAVWVEDLHRLVIDRRPGRVFQFRAHFGGLDLDTGALIDPETMRADHGIGVIRGTLKPTDERMGELVSYQGIDGVDREILRGDIIRILAGLLFEERARQAAANTE